MCQGLAKSIAVIDVNQEATPYSPYNAGIHTVQIMFDNPSLITRVAIGKFLGFVVGLIGLALFPVYWPDASWIERIAFLFWYTTIGAFVGVMGVFDWHPVLRIPLPWWLRSSIIGAWMNLVLALFIHERLGEMMVQAMGEDGVLQSPFWFVLEGALVGLFIGYFATRFGGEGPETVHSSN